MAQLINNSLSKFSTLASLTKKVTILKNAPVVLIQTNHKFSTKKPELTTNEKDIIKSVFISQSNDVFTNLALEDWLYRNIDFNNHHVLLLWRNTPCVVIGRHQNPWMEANVDYLAANDIEIARRNSGGGAVYHDKGNLNLTFFTPRERYNRKSNLELISRALFREWGLNVNVSSREDLLLNDHYKISGTASKLGRPNAYHHCTLLVNAEKKHLRNALLKKNDSINTNATKSIPSPVCNLREANFHVTVEGLLQSVGLEFMRTTPLTLQDGGHELISKQRGFQLVNPTDKWFPGLAQLREEFLSWNWRFGKTPKFSITRKIETASIETKPTEVTMGVEKGEINDVALKLTALHLETATETSSIATNLNGEKFNTDILNSLEKTLLEAQSDENVRKSAMGIA